MNALPQISLQNEWQSFTTFLIGESHYTISETEFHFVMEFPAQEDLNLAFDHIYCLDNSLLPFPLLTNLLLPCDANSNNMYLIILVMRTEMQHPQNYAVGQIMAIVNTSEKSARGYYTVT